jgi:hypothetical protein
MARLSSCSHYYEIIDTMCHFPIAPALPNGMPDLFGHADFETTNNGANGP